MATIPPPSSTAARPSRFAGIEGLRAIAALAVLAMHVWQFTGVTAGLRFTRVTPMPVVGVGWIDRAFMQGVLGVQLFFVLSGVLLFHPFASWLVDRVRRPGVRRYLVRRARRIFPLYLLVLAAFVVALALGGTLRYGTASLLANLLLVQAYLPGVGNVLPLAWTLPIEIGFYVAIPVVAVVLDRVLAGVASRGVRIAAVVGAIVALGAVSLVLRLGDVESLGPVQSARTLAWNLDGFAPGMLVAVAIAARRRPLGRVAPRVLLVAGCAVFGVGVRLRMLGFGAAGGSELARDVWPLAIALGSALVVAGVVFASERQRLVTHLLDSRPMRWLGEISYGVYLWHWVVLALLRRAGAFRTDGDVPALLVNGVLVLGFTLAGATCTYRFVERPLMRGLAGRRARRPREAAMEMAAP